MFTSKYSRKILMLMVQLEASIINLFGFTFKNNMYEWGENLVQGHPNCT